MKYDSFSNILETKDPNKNHVSYIYGYNKTLPVVKLENINYDSIDLELISQINLITSSNNVDLSLLNNIINQLNTNYPNALISYFLYKPLIGIARMVDFNGKATNYYYDEFNRLSYISDNENNILKSYEYHYK